MSVARHQSNAPVTTRRSDQMVSFQRMVTAAVTLIVGILVFNQVEDALPSFDYANNSGVVDPSPIVGTIESAFQIAPVVLIVLVAGLILAQVSGFSK